MLVTLHQKLSNGGNSFFFFGFETLSFVALQCSVPSLTRHAFVVILSVCEKLSRVHNINLITAVLVQHSSQILHNK